MFEIFKTENKNVSNIISEIFKYTNRDTNSVNMVNETIVAEPTTDDLAYYELIKYGLLYVELDDDGKIKKLSEDFAKLFDTPMFQLEGKMFSTLFSKKNINDKDNFYFLKSLKEKSKFKGEIKITHLNKNLFFSVVMYPFKKDNLTDKILITFINNTPIYTQMEESNKIFFYDRLTNLGNREKLMQDLSLYDKKVITFLLININFFRNINYGFGYEVGDILLKEISEFLDKRKIKKSTVIYRPSSDKFGLFIPQKIDKVELIDYIKSLCNEMSNKIFMIDNHKISVNISIGAAIGSKDIFRYAENALYNSRINQIDYTIYDDNNKTTCQKSVMIDIIKEAIVDNLVIPYFQPIMNAKTNRVEKYEILMRILDKKGNIYLPADFLHIAKNSKLYPSLVSAMLPKAFRYNKLTSYKFSLNLFNDDFFDPIISEAILKSIKEFKIGNRLILEIVNTNKIKDIDKMVDILNNYKRLGCQIAIDNFGKNLKELKDLLRLNIDYIKINKNFIANVDEDLNIQNLIRKLVFIANRENIKTIAEFVYNDSIYNKVKELNIDYMQGFYISPPDKKLYQNKMDTENDIDLIYREIDSYNSML